MDHREIAFGHDQRPCAKPVDQLVAIRRGEDRVERVLAVRLAVAGGDREEMEVVVAEHRDRRISKCHHLAKDSEGAGAAVDEIADEPQTVLRRREPDEVEQLAELGVTTLDVADRVKGHEDLRRVGRQANASG